MRLEMPQQAPHRLLAWSDGRERGDRGEHGRGSAPHAGGAPVLGALPTVQMTPHQVVVPVVPRRLVGLQNAAGQRTVPGPEAEILLRGGPALAHLLERAEAPRHELQKCLGPRGRARAESVTHESDERVRRYFRRIETVFDRRPSASAQQSTVPAPVARKVGVKSCFLESLMMPSLLKDQVGVAFVRVA